MLSAVTNQESFNSDEFKKLIKIMIANYGSQITEIDVEFYEQLANGFGFKQFEIAVKNHMLESSFKPKVNEIKAQIDKLQIAKPALVKKDAIHVCDNTRALVRKYGKTELTCGSIEE